MKRRDRRVFIFDNLRIAEQPKFVLEQIQTIQKDFLELIGQEVPATIRTSIDEAMRDSIKSNSKEAHETINSFRTTWFQNPLDFRELSTCSSFVTDAIQQNFRTGKNLSNYEQLAAIPIATVRSSSLMGMIARLNLTDDQDAKLPCVLVSEQCAQTAWICHHLSTHFKQKISATEWRTSFDCGEVRVGLNHELINYVAMETLKAFMCDTPASHAGYYFDANEHERLNCRLMQCFLIAHEYSHIIFNHKARYNDESQLPLSGIRLRNLQRTLEPILQNQSSRFPIRSRNLAYFFGAQQDELEADYLAFSVLYKKISKSEKKDNILPELFRAIGNCIMWIEIHEALGRTLRNGPDWSESPLHSSEFYLIGDLTWRKRYPSAYSRLHYLYERAIDDIPEEHRELLEFEFREVELVFAIWRKIIIAAAGSLSSMWYEESAHANALKNHFVWKGLPTSMRSSVGYYDHRDSFLAYNLSDYLS